MVVSKNREPIERLSGICRDELLERILPFWVGKSLDRANGGYLTGLPRAGDVFDTDKFIWLQGWQVGGFSVMYAMAKAYELTGDERCADWFRVLYHYTWQHFRDPEHPEWFGYLNRGGEVLLPLKGGTWKGFSPCAQIDASDLENTGGGQPSGISYR